MTILVTGATGNVGRHLVGQLVRDGHRVRALTRDPAAANLPAGVEVVAGDLAAPHTLGPVFEGVTGVHLITFGGNDYTPLTTGPQLVDLAAKAGARRVTVLWHGWRGAVEQAVQASGLEWTLLEPVEFMSNALGWVESIRSEGVVREAFATEPSAMVHESDIAAVAAAALVEGGQGGQTYSLTGPEVLTVPDKVRVLATALRRQIGFVELTEEQARQRMRDSGVSEENIEFVIGWHANPPEVAYTVSPAVERVTGRPARTFAQWAAEHAEAFR